jgi:prenyltransferase beta subunit
MGQHEFHTDAYRIWFEKPQGKSLLGCKHFKSVNEIKFHLRYVIILKGETYHKMHQKVCAHYTLMKGITIPSPGTCSSLPHTLQAINLLIPGSVLQIMKKFHTVSTQNTSHYLKICTSILKIGS